MHFAGQKKKSNGLTHAVVVVDLVVVVDGVVVRISVTINMSRFLIGRAIGLIKNLIVGVGKASQKILCLQTAVSKHFL